MTAKPFDVQTALAAAATLRRPEAQAAEAPECGNPECESGFIPVQCPDGVRMARCPECAERFARRKAQATLVKAGLAETIYDVDWSTLDLSHESWQLAREYADDVSELLIGGGLSLIFAGDYGRGKTQAATMILSQAAQEGHTVARVKWGQFVRSVRGSYSKDSTVSENDLVSALVAPALILLDDIGAADKASEHNERLLTSVIDERYDRGRPMILTTNLSRDELRAHLGERAYSRLWENGDVVLFDGPNYRERYERPKARAVAAQVRERARRRQLEQAAD